MSEHGSARGRLNDEEARTRKRVAAHLDASRQSAGSESGDGGSGGGNGGSGGGGGSGRKDFTEALLIAAMRTPVGRRGISSAEFLVHESARHVLDKRAMAGRGEAFFPDDQVRFSPDVSLGIVSTVQRSSPRTLAQAIGAEVRHVQEAQKNLTARDVDAALRADYKTGRIGDAARTAVDGSGTTPRSASGDLWARGLDEGAVDRMNHREVARHLLSAGNSTDPGARDALMGYALALDGKHEPFAFSFEANAIAQVSSLDRAGTAGDVNAVMAASAWQADLHPVPIEDYLTRAPALPSDRRANLHLLRDSAQIVAAAVYDGKAPASLLIDLTENAKRHVPGFAEKYDEARARDLPQGDAVLYAYDGLRGHPSVRAPRDRAELIAAGNAVGADLRAHKAERMADPRRVMDSRLPENVPELARAAEVAGGSGVARPREALADARATADRSGVRYPRGEAARGAHRDGRNVRVGRLDKAQVAAGNRHTGAKGVQYRRGETVRAVRNESAAGLPRRRAQIQAARRRLMAQYNKHRRTATTTTTRRAAVR